MEILVLLLMLTVTLIMLIMAILMGTFAVMHIYGAPFVPTPISAVKKMLEFADFKEGETIMDLGSGDGIILLVAAKQFKAKKAIGYEIHPFLVWVTKIRAKLWRVSKVIKVNRKNFFKSKIEDVDLVTLYLWPQTMEKLKKKLKADLAPNTRIISRGFEFKDVKPIKSTEGPLHWLHLYRVGDL